MLTKTKAVDEASPRTKARIAGALFLLFLLTAFFAQGYVSDRLVRLQDPAVTASSVLANETLFRLAYATFLIEMSCQVATTALVYEILKPAGRGLALMAAYFGLTGCVIKTFARLFFIAPILVLHGGPALAAIDAPQLQALALLLFKLNNQGAGMALVFLGIATALNGWVILRSTFLPRTLGVVGVVSGTLLLGFLYAPLARLVSPVAMGLALVELLFMSVWLLVFGVNEERWKQQAVEERSSLRI
jgi:hypothetical protein